MVPSILDICNMYMAALSEYCSTADTQRLRVADDWMRALGDEIRRVDRIRRDIENVKRVARELKWRE